MHAEKSIIGQVITFDKSETTKKKKFGDRYPKYKAQPSYKRNFQYQIIEYKDIDNNENIAHYFEDLSIDADYNCKLGSSLFYIKSEQFYTSICQLDSFESKTIINILANNVFKH